MASKIFKYLKNTQIYDAIYDIYSIFRFKRQLIEVVLDYLSTRRSLGSPIKIQNNDNKRIGILAFNGVLLNTKIEATLMIPFIKRGYSVDVFLRDSGNPWTKRYYSLFANVNFVNINSFKLTKHELCEIENKCNSLKKESLNFQKVKKWEFRGVLIGPTLLSNIQRKNRLGSPDLQNPILVKSIYHKLPEILGWVIKIDKYLERNDISLLLAIEANDWNRPFIDLAIKKGINCIQMVQPFRDDALIFKKLNSVTFGVNPNSITKENILELNKKPWLDVHNQELAKEYDDRYSGKWYLQSRNQVNTKKKSKEEILSILKLSKLNKTACLFSHILWDANLFYGDDIYEDYSDWLLNSIKIMSTITNVNWIIKLHPANIWKRQLENERGELAEITLLKKHNLFPPPCNIHLLYPETDIDTYSLFNAIDYAITVRGTVGIEIASLGIPVITAGTGRYSNLGFTFDASNKMHYEEMLRQIPKSSLFMSDSQIKLAKWHAYAIFKLRPWEFDYMKISINTGSTFINSYNTTAIQSLSDLMTNRRLEDWYQYSTNPKEVDYMRKF